MSNFYKAKVLKHDVVQIEQNFYEAKRLQKLLKMLKKSKKKVELSTDAQNRLIVSFDTGQYIFNASKHVRHIEQEIVEVQTHELEFLGEPNYAHFNADKRRQVNLLQFN